MKHVFTCIAILCFSPFLFAQTDICGIDLTPETYVASFANGENVNLSFEYATDEPGGVRIFARPFTNGSLTPGYGASGSPLYMGSGVGNAFFTINSGAVLVDEIRFQIWNADQTTLIRQFFVPVQYWYGELGVHDFSFNTDQKIGSFLLGENAEISFDYNITYPGGVRIFLRPFTDGALTPGYGASGSPNFSGAGSFTATFSINSGVNVNVDSIRVTILNDDQSQTLNTFFIPVNWYWSTTKITDVSVLGSNFPANGDDRTIQFNYETTEAAGVRIFPRPISNGSLTPNYSACGSPIFNGAGIDDCNFTISADNHRVDHIRFIVTNPDQTQDLLEIRYPADIVFGDFLIEEVVTCPPSPSRLIHGEPINTYYDYFNLEGANARIFVRPFTDGALSPGYGASGSPAYAPGTGSGDDFFTINSGNVIVDQIRFNITDEAQSQEWANYFYDVHYVFGEPTVTSSFTPPIAETLELHIAPNPMAQQATIRINSATSQEVNIQLIDALGRILYQWPSQMIGSGMEAQLLLNAQELGLKNGMYAIQLLNEQEVLTKTILIQQ